jgi:serine/threonine protein kinase
MQKALMCPQCNAPLTPHRFASSIVCAYCGATVKLDEASVSAESFHQTYRAWNSPLSYSIPAAVSIGESHWAIDRFLANGEISAVYAARRARWPTELAVLKVLREQQSTDLFENEWQVIRELQKSTARGAENFLALIPQPILHGRITGGQHTGQFCSLFRWASGFKHTFDAVQKAYPQGVPPRASIWMWRRILEVLSFLHASGVVHGAVLPPNLLVQENEHGVRLIGFSLAGPAGQKLPHVPMGFEAFYPPAGKSHQTLTPQLDLVMSARCIAAVLGADLLLSSVPPGLPASLVRLIQDVAQGGISQLAAETAWGLRTRLGQIADDAYGAPEFVPIAMPD